MINSQSPSSQTAPTTRDLAHWLPTGARTIWQIHEGSKPASRFVPINDNSYQSSKPQGSSR